MLSWNRVKLKQVQNIFFLSKWQKPILIPPPPHLNPTDFLTTSFNGASNVMKSFIKRLYKLANPWKLLTSLTDFGVGQSTWP
jgi:hypothetical protein